MRMIIILINTITFTSPNVNRLDVPSECLPRVSESETNRVTRVSPLQRLATKRYQSRVRFNGLAPGDLISASVQEVIAEVGDSAPLLRNAGFCTFANEVTAEGLNGNSTEGQSSTVDC